jgi:hypothetical protein
MCSISCRRAWIFRKYHRIHPLSSSSSPSIWRPNCHVSAHLPWAARMYLWPTATFQASTRRDSAESTRFLVLDLRIKGYLETVEFATREYLSEELGDTVWAPSGTSTPGSNHCQTGNEKRKQIHTRAPYRWSRDHLKGQGSNKAEQLVGEAEMYSAYTTSVTIESYRDGHVGDRVYRWFTVVKRIPELLQWWWYGRLGRRYAF